jgi:hypothetical protein
MHRMTRSSVDVTAAVRLTAETGENIELPSSVKNNDNL